MMFNLMGSGKTRLGRRKAVSPRIDGLSRVEFLEERLVLASQVAATFSSGNLTLKGSTGDDNITVTVTGTNVVTLTSTGTITGGTTFTVSGTLTINMDAGSDTVILAGGGGGGTYAGSKLSIDLGTGNNTLNTSGSLTVSRDFTLSCGGGTDTINLGTTGGTSFVVGGISRLDTGSGSDTVTLGTTGTTALNGLVSITLGDGNDRLEIGDHAGSNSFSAANNYTFNAGSGNDTFKGSTISLASYNGGAITSKLNPKLTSKITSFEIFL
jgi:hypothetical protein